MADVSRTSSQAGHEDGVLRAPLHFWVEWSAGLPQHIDTRLARLKAEFLPDLKVVPLQCNTHGAHRSRKPPRRDDVCADCHQVHAGEYR